IQPMWKWARRKLGLKTLNNPFENISIANSDVVVPRRVKPGELEKLLQASTKCKSFYRYYVPLAIDIALETGMRREEIFDLTWENVNLDNRRILIRKTKMGVPRLIVMSYFVECRLGNLEVALKQENAFNEADRVMFPLAPDLEHAIDQFEDEF